MIRGRVGALNEEALAYNRTVLARFSASGSEQLGAQRTDADTADAVAIPGVKVFKAGAVNLAVLQVGE